MQNQPQTTIKKQRNAHKKSSSEGTMGVATNSPTSSEAAIAAAASSSSTTTTSGTNSATPPTSSSPATPTELTNQLQYQLNGNNKNEPNKKHLSDSGLGLSEEDLQESTESSGISDDSDLTPSEDSDEFITFHTVQQTTPPSSSSRHHHRRSSPRILSPAQLKLQTEPLESGDVELNPLYKYWCLAGFGVLFLMAYVRTFLESNGFIKCDRRKEKNRDGYPLLIPSWLDMFTEYIYRRVSDIFAQPICGNPGQIVRVHERISRDRNHTFELTGKTFDAVNLASYDYLGMSIETNQPSIESSIKNFGVGVGITGELGRTIKHQELESKMASFIGKEDCVVFGMGFATNSANIPALVASTSGGDCLLLGDHHCHMSIRSGMHISKTTFRFFKHNDFIDLEKQIIRALREGVPRTNRKWAKIIIIVEGVYSMEGTIVDLPRLIEIKKRYKCYLYVDEAHSIGAIGPNGGGVVDYFGCDPDDIDLLMGTLTKTFAAAGGYIACSKNIANHIRAKSIGNYSGAMSAPVAQQIINMLDIVADARYDEHGPGKVKIDRLLENTHYMRDRLRELGFVLYGHYDSPVIPVLVYFPAMAGSICRMALRQGLACVVAGYPATSLPSCRIRLCMSASLDRGMLDRAIDILSKLGDQCGIKHNKK